MMRLIRASAIALVALSTTACAGFYTAPVVPPTAFVFTSIAAPMDVQFDETATGTKRGEASTTNVLGLVSFGDASARAAAQQGGITVVKHADYEFLSVLGIFSRFTTIVYGD